MSDHAYEGGYDYLNDRFADPGINFLLYPTMT